MLNVNVSKIREARLANVATTREFEVAVAKVEAYFNDSANFLQEQLAVNVELCLSNFAKFRNLVLEAGLDIKESTAKSVYTVTLPDEVVAPQEVPVFVTPPVTDVFVPTADPILEQQPIAEVSIIQDSLQKPVSKVSSNPNDMFVMPEGVLSYKESPF